MKIITVSTLSLSVALLTSCVEEENVQNNSRMKAEQNVRLSAIPDKVAKPAKAAAIPYADVSLGVLPSVNVDILQYITEIADRKRNDWIHRDFSIPPFSLLKPIKPKYKKFNNSLLKKEFETTEEYDVRVANMKKLQEENVQKLDLEYQNMLYKYKSSLSEYDTYIENEKAQRLEASNDIFTAYVKEGVENMLGTPSVKELVYSADLESFYGTLYSKISSFTRRIVINVPIGIAQDFKDGVQYALPDIDFALTEDNSLYIDKVSIVFKGVTYPASIVRNVLNIVQGKK